jgi:hypothetical protein
VRALGALEDVENEKRVEMCGSPEGSYDEKDVVPPSKRCEWWVNRCSLYLDRKHESDGDCGGQEEGE